MNSRIDRMRFRPGFCFCVPVPAFDSRSRALLQLLYSITGPLLPVSVGTELPTFNRNELRLGLVWSRLLEVSQLPPSTARFKRGRSCLL